MDDCGSDGGLDYGLFGFGFGFDHGSSGMDAIDFIGGAFGRNADGSFSFPNSDIAALKQADPAKQNAFGVRVTHGAVDVVQLFLLCGERKGIVKVPSILVAGQSIDSTVDGFLPPNAWTATNGCLPGPTIEGVGKSTRVFRNFYRIGRKRWGVQTAFNSAVDAHMDVSCMTWSDRQVGDFRSQLFIRVVSNSDIEPRRYSWIIDPTSNLAHRREAKEAVTTVATVLSDVYKPSLKSIEARNAQEGR